VRAIWVRGWIWGVGALGALLVVGPGLAPGGWLNLDLVATPTVQLPSGVWGLGPDLPRRVPVFAFVAWTGHFIGGELAMKLFIVAIFTVAFGGAARLVGDAPAVARVGAGVLYALGPFAVTRVGTGQLTVAAAMAVLPWALPSILDPGRNLRRTLRWSVVMGLTGFVGGIFALLALAIGCAGHRWQRGRQVLLIAAVSQLPWLIPGLVVLSQGGTLSSGGAFRTDVGGLDGPFRLASGYGFWLQALQSGGHGGVAIVLIGAFLIGLGCIGHSRLPAEWRTGALVLAVIGGGYAYLGARPFGIDVPGALDGLPGASAVREGQRLLPLALVWLVPAAVLGALRLAERVRTAAAGAAWSVAPLMVAIVLCAPGIWGISGALNPVHYPKAWHAALLVTQAKPGPVVALPFHEYLDIGFADDRRVLNPLPDYLGGDVITSSDPELGSPAQEAVDDREPRVRALVPAMRAGRTTSAQLAALGVRWVVLLHEVDWKRYRGLASDPGLRRVVTGTSLDLYEVRAWKGSVIARSGRVVGSSGVVSPLERVDPSGPATWFQPPATGWMRGTGAATRVGNGVVLPGGRGPVWYWPTLLVLLGYLVTAAAVFVPFFRLRTRRVGPHQDPKDG
jgi:hypothetical protein